MYWTYHWIGINAGRLSAVLDIYISEPYTYIAPNVILKENEF